MRGWSDQPPWIAGHDQDLGRRFFKLPDRRRPARPVEAKRQAPRRTMFGERRFRRDDRFGPILVPLGQSQVAVSRLEQPSFAITRALLYVLRRRRSRGALAFFRSSCGLGRFLPYVPRKILPRFDRLSPLPIGHSLKNMLARFQESA